MAFDVLLKGGLVVDGTGVPGFLGDVAISAGRIAEVGNHLDGPSRRVIDASGLVVAPGFLDVHTHYDAQVTWDPLLSTSTQYGVTTVVIGNCGLTIAPVISGGEEHLVRMLSGVEGMPSDSLRVGVPWGWDDFGSYLNFLDRPLGPNLVAQVGHSALRSSVMGPEAAMTRAATTEEIGRMAVELRKALGEGAWGFTTSTTPSHNDVDGRPVPSRLAPRPEFEALADVVGEFPFGVIGINPGSKFSGFSPEERELMTVLSRRGGAMVNWNPLAYWLFPELWEQNLSVSIEAEAAGARVFAVYDPGPPHPSKLLLETCFTFAPLPHWKPLLKTDTEQKLRAFRDPQTRRELRDDLDDNEVAPALTANLRTMWDTLRVTQVYSSENAAFADRTVGEIAADLGRDPFDVMLDIAVADELRTCFIREKTGGEDAGARRAFEVLSKSDHVLFGGSDAGAHLDMMADGSLTIDAIASRVRDEGVFSLEAMVRGFTSVLADAFGLVDRGRLVAGAAADIVVFDLDDLGSGPAEVSNDLPGGHARLVTKPSGIVHTIVNGEPLFEDGHASGRLSGRLLRSPGSKARSAAETR